MSAHTHNAGSFEAGTLEMEPNDMPWGERLICLSDPDAYKFGISRPLDVK